jgi:hypothetical protein
MINNSGTLTLVRVKDIILDESHPDFLKYGKGESIGIIKYVPIDRYVDTSDTSNLPPAFPLNQSIKTLPLINEVVFIVEGVRADSKDAKSTYYFSPVSIFNDINFNASYDTLDKSNLGPGYEFPENEKKRPLYPFHGDTILQGRHGQSIRFTGAKSFSNIFTNDSNSGSPLTILSNGHREISTADLYLEDINKDDSSIYLSSDHIIPLEQVRTKYKGIKTKPILAKNYRGKQILVNSGRLVFNAYEDDIVITSKNNLSLTSNYLSLDAEQTIGLDAKKIYLGERALKFELQPVLLGNQTELFLDTLLTALGSLADALKGARTVDQKTIPKLNVNGYTLEATIKGLQNQINPNGESLLKSKKVYTE